MAAKLVHGTFLKQIVTSAVELSANPQSKSSFYFVTSTGVYEMKWDPLDYMAVARRVSDPEPQQYFVYHAVLDTIWCLGEPLRLAARDGQCNWQDFGTIDAICFDESPLFVVKCPKSIRERMLPAP